MDVSKIIEKINDIFHQEFILSRQKGKGTLESKDKSMEEVLSKISENEKDILLRYFILSHVDERSGRYYE